METRGKFSRAQVAQLLKPVEPFRVVTGAHVKPHLAQQDVLAHLIRVFGFGNYDVEVLQSDLIFEEPMTNSSNKPAWRVGYRALVRLTIRDEFGDVVARYDGGSTGESEGQPSRADSHDLAFKSALSTATKRAAIHLGDQFGLSLYNKGQMEALVMGSMIGTDWNAEKDVQEGVARQEEDGGAVADRAAQDQAGEPEEKPAPSALPPATKRATTGRQGTRKRKAAEPKPEAAAPEAPVATPEPEPEPAAKPTPEPAPAAPEDPERAERERMAAEQERQVTERERIIATADDVDRADEVAVAQWNTTHGKATGHYLTSDAERAAQAERLSQDAPAPAVEPEPFVDTQTGDVYETQEALDAAIQARVQAKQAARAEGAAAPAAEPEQNDGPSAYEVATAEEPRNYIRRIEAATTDPELRQVWNDAQAAKEITTELHMAIAVKKDQVK